MRMAPNYRTNHILVPIGGDFNFQDAKMNFQFIDILIKEMNARYDDVNLFYSTPYDYVNAVHSKRIEWPVRYDDMLPYQVQPHETFSGYYTSRPNFKGLAREVSSELNSHST